MSNDIRNLSKWLNEDQETPIDRQALARVLAMADQQEPVAYAVYHRMGGSKSLHWPEQHSDAGDHNQYQLVPLYTSPQLAQQITEAQVEAALKAAHMHSTPESRKDMRQAIEAAHNIKEQP